MNYKDMIATLTRDNVNNMIHGRSPLHQCIAHGDYQGAKKCIEMGAEINLACKDGRRAIHYALDCHSIRILRLVLKHGATMSTWSELEDLEVTPCFRMWDIVEEYGGFIRG